MGFYSIRESLAGVAIAALLTNSAAAAPSPLMGRACLANIVSDLSCADSSIMTRCIAIERVDAELLATCLEAAGCTEDEAENALWITEKCQTTTSTSGDSTQADLEADLRRRFHARKNNKRADSTTTSEESSTTATATSTSSSSSETSSSTSTSTSSSASSTSTSATSTSSSTTTSTSTSTSSASATSTSTSSYADLDIGLSSAIVGSVMGIAAALAFGGVFICAWREGAAKRKAKREVAQKEALMSNIG